MCTFNREDVSSRCPSTKMNYIEVLVNVQVSAEEVGLHKPTSIWYVADVLLDMSTVIMSCCDM